jgi:hypothetical protein
MLVIGRWWMRRTSSVSFIMFSLSGVVLRIASLMFFVSLPAMGQDSVTRSQQWCAKLAQNSLEKTKTERPEVAKTILSYLYEYYARKHTCVGIMEYRSEKDGRPYAQVIAINLVTTKPMKGYDEV